MKKSRYSDEQIVRILREPDKAPIAEAAKCQGVNEQSIYGWRKHFGDIDSADIKNLELLVVGEWADAGILDPACLRSCRSRTPMPICMLAC